MTKRICDFCGKEDNRIAMYMLDSRNGYETLYFDGMDICNDCIKLLRQTIRKKQKEERLKKNRKE